MSTSPSAIPKVRTYAADLNSTRSAQNIPTTNQKAAVVPEPIVTETVVTDTVASQTIPPFHTFSKTERGVPSQSTTPANTAVPKVAISGSDTQNETQKILTASSALQASGNLKESLPAVIITDTKHKRFKLSEAIVTSMQDWWNDKKQTAKQKKIPKYTVPVAERRKGVIQKATVKTGRESSADHSAVLTRIKATKQIPHTQAPVPLPPITSGATAWGAQVPATPKVAIQNERLVKRQPTPREPITPLTFPQTKPAQAWETDIQAKANALAEPAAVPPSPIILTGKEFSKTKQARTNESSRSVVVPTIPIIQPLPHQVVTPAEPTAQPKIIAAPVVPIRAEVISPQIPSTPKVTTVESSIVVPEVLPVTTKQPAAEMVPLTPYTRPKILPVIPKVPAPQPTAVSVPVVTPITPAPVAPSVTQAASQTPEQPQREERRFAPPRESKRNFFAVFAQTNSIVFVTAAILVLVVGSGVGLRAYRNAPVATVDTTTQVTDTTFPGSTLYTETNFVSNKNQLGEQIKTLPSNTDSLAEIRFVNEQGNALSASEFLTLFDAPVPFDFVSSLNNVTFGNYRGAPWILLTITDKNTALGGMLTWETSMVRNLAPIFGTTEITTSTRFTDAIVNSNDVRLIKNNTGTEEIVYGFVGTDKLLITSNTTAFLNLAQNVY